MFERNNKGQFTRGMSVPWQKIPIEKICPKCETKFSVKPSLNRVICCSISCGQKGKESQYKGEKSNFWKGGITPINIALRMSTNYKDWRIKVFRKDGYRCFDCGIYGVSLEANHILPFSLFPRLRFDINNGESLCKSCHRVKTNAQMRGDNKLIYNF